MSYPTQHHKHNKFQASVCVLVSMYAIYIYILVRTAEDRKILLEHLLFLSVVQINIKIFGKYIYNTVTKGNPSHARTHTHTLHAYITHTTCSTC